MSSHHSGVEGSATPLRHEMVSFALNTLGTKVLGPYPVPEGATTVQYEIDRTAATWAALSTTTRAAKLSAEISYDNGATWMFAAAMETSGGDHVMQGGATAATSTLTFTIGQPAMISRLYRVTVTLDSNVVTACHAQWS